MANSNSISHVTLTSNIFQSAVGSFGTRSNTICPTTEMEQLLKVLYKEYSTLTKEQLTTEAPMVPFKKVPIDDLYTLERECVIKSEFGSTLFTQALCKGLKGEFQKGGHPLEIKINLKVDMKWTDSFEDGPGLNFTTPLGVATLKKSMISHKVGNQFTDALYFPGLGHEIVRPCQSHQYGKVNVHWYYPDDGVNVSLAEFKERIKEARRKLNYESFELGEFRVPQFNIKTKENILTNQAFKESEIGRTLTSGLVPLNIFNVTCTMYNTKEGAGGTAEIECGSTRSLSEPDVRDISITRPFYQEIMIDNFPVLSGYISDPEPLESVRSLLKSYAVDTVVDFPSSKRISDKMFEQMLELEQVPEQVPERIPEQLSVRVPEQLSVRVPEQVNVSMYGTRAPLAQIYVASPVIAPFEWPTFSIEDLKHGEQMVDCHPHTIVLCTYNVAPRAFCDCCKRQMNHINIDGTVYGYSSTCDNFDMCLECFKNHHIKPAIPSVFQIIQMYKRKTA